MNISEELQVILVLKGGGDFKPEHVHRLAGQIKKHLTIPHKIFCLTDYYGGYIENIEAIPLLDKLPGWWSKIEIFRAFTNALYFDLDTTIIGNIDFLGEKPSSFVALKTRHRSMGSGIMRWHGDLSILYKCFMESSKRLMESFKWDQEFINFWLYESGVKLQYFQKLFPGEIISYKNDYLPTHEKGIPIPKPSIIYFHGKPRPWDIPEIT